MAQSNALKCNKLQFVKLLTHLFKQQGLPFNENLASYSKLFSITPELAIEVAEAGLLGCDIFAVDSRDPITNGFTNLGIQEINETCYIGMIVAGSNVMPTLVAIYPKLNNLGIYIPSTATDLCDQYIILEDLNSNLSAISGKDLQHQEVSKMLEQGKQLRNELVDENGEKLFSNMDENGNRVIHIDDEDDMKRTEEDGLTINLQKKHPVYLHDTIQYLPTETELFSGNAEKHLRKQLEDLNGNITTESVLKVLNSDGDLYSFLAEHNLVDKSIEIESDEEENLLGVHNLGDLTIFGIKFVSENTLPVFVYLHFTTIGWKICLPVAGNLINSDTLQPLMRDDSSVPYIYNKLLAIIDEKEAKKLQYLFGLVEQTGKVAKEDLDNLQETLSNTLKEEYQHFSDYDNHNLEFKISWRWIQEDVMTRFNLYSK